MRGRRPKGMAADDATRKVSRIRPDSPSKDGRLSTPYGPPCGVVRVSRLPRFDRHFSHGAEMLSIAQRDLPRAGKAEHASGMQRR